LNSPRLQVHQTRIGKSSGIPQISVRGNSLDAAAAHAKPSDVERFARCGTDLSMIDRYASGYRQRAMTWRVRDSSEVDRKTS
jgi:hypothetical protein